jgi:hypothetical protein
MLLWLMNLGFAGSDAPEVSPWTEVPDPGTKIWVALDGGAGSWTEITDGTTEIWTPLDGD